MSSQFKFLFTPIEIGPVTVRNRIYSTALHTGFADKGYPAERLAYYHAEKAKGGVGLTIVEGSIIHPTSEYHPVTPDSVNLYEERVIPGLKKMADMVHEHGAKILCQLWHAGHHAYPALSYLPSLSCSPVPSVVTRFTPKELEQEEVDELIDAFGRSAKNVVAGGLDGVQLHAGHGYLVQQFNSPLFNKRTDKYGGSLENRMRFMLEAIDRIREYVGYSTVLAVRMCADELMEGGITVEEAKVTAQKLEETGKVDFLDVTATTYHQLHIQHAPMYTPPGTLLYAAAAIKEVVKKTPVGGVGRINDALMAERTLEEGKTDMVAMTRAHLADPEIGNKARQGRIDDIRPCIACGQCCSGRRFAGLPVGCTMNPTLGREKEWGIGTLKPATVRKHVAVVGGGPAGMEAARVAALRGHDVALYEKEDELGGQVNLAAKLPGRDEVGGIVRWEKLQLEKLGVKTVTRKDVTAELVEKVNPDAVVLATGATPIRDGMQGFTVKTIPGWNGGNVTVGEDILRGTVKAGRNVVILDEDGGIEPLGIAEMLAAEGRSVEVLTRMPFVGVDLVNNLHLPHVYQRVKPLGVKLTPHMFIKEVAGNTVIAFDVYTGQERRIEGVDTVVLVTGKAANNTLYRQLKGRVKGLYAVGDCVTPRKIDAATYDGHRVGRLI